MAEVSSRAKPDMNHRSFLIELSHKRDLLRPFLVIPLVNTYRICLYDNDPVVSTSLVAFNGL